MISRPTSPAPRRSVLKAAGGLAGILALGRAPAIAQTQPKKLIIAHIVPPPESGAIALKYFADQVTERSKGRAIALGLSEQREQCPEVVFVPGGALALATQRAF